MSTAGEAHSLSTPQEDTEIMEDKAHEGRSIIMGCFKQWPLLFMSKGDQVLFICLSVLLNDLIQFIDAFLHPDPDEVFPRRLIPV